MDDQVLLREALAEARKGLAEGGLPIGSVLADSQGRIVARGHNLRVQSGDPTAHAETLALRQASQTLGSWRVLDSVMYVTLEPCTMCAGAIVLSRIPRVVFAASDPKAGAAGSVLDLLNVPALNHRPQVAGGLLAQEAGVKRLVLFHHDPSHCDDVLDDLLLDAKGTAGQGGPEVLAAYEGLQLIL